MSRKGSHMPGGLSCALEGGIRTELASTSHTGLPVTQPVPPPSPQGTQAPSQTPTRSRCDLPPIPALVRGPVRATVGGVEVANALAKILELGHSKLLGVPLSAFGPIRVNCVTHIHSHTTSLPHPPILSTKLQINSHIPPPRPHTPSAFQTIRLIVFKNLY